MAVNPMQKKATTAALIAVLVTLLMVGCSDMGTGCDTTLAQVAAECLKCDTDKIAVSGADTDTSPYDSGSYASSTAYITGKAVEKTALHLIEEIRATAAQMLECGVEDTRFEGTFSFSRIVSS